MTQYLDHPEVHECHFSFFLKISIFQDFIFSGTLCLQQVSVFPSLHLLQPRRQPRLSYEIIWEFLFWFFCFFCDFFKKSKSFKMTLKHYFWLFSWCGIARKYFFTSIAPVQARFGPTSTQNLDFLMFLTYFRLFWPFPGSPLPFHIAFPYSHSIPHVLAL